MSEYARAVGEQAEQQRKVEACWMRWHQILLS